jgi:hypothetical protein
MPSDAGEPAPLRAVPTPRAGPDRTARSEPTLSQRVPQASLAAGLRREARAAPAQAPTPAQAPAPTTAVGDPRTARDALSRFQASQRQAREAVRRGEVPDPEAAE